ncbi:MAG TPA: Rho-binding antiterminator [Burkholderiales bacterium]|nr:Rho-binding antiterminator [Burkholderiales bacterium]
MTEDKHESYAPIDCDRYSEYELAIMHRQKLRLRWHDGNVVYEQTMFPLDLKTVQHEEFLICRDDAGATRTIRLDHIQKWEAA